MSRRHAQPALVRLSGLGEEWLLRALPVETSRSRGPVPALADLDAFVSRLSLWHSASCTASAAEPKTETYRLAQAFAETLSKIPEVRAVTLDLSGTEPVVTTYIRRRQPDVRSLIYAVEHEMYQMFPSEEVEFRVKSLDTPGCRIPAPGSPQVHVIYQSR